MLSSFHIVLAMKPTEGNFASNAVKHGVAGINIDGTRIGTETIQINTLERWSGFGQEKRPDYMPRQQTGRFPANLILDDSEDVMALFPENAGAGGRASGPTRGKLGTQGRFGSANGNMGESCFYDDSGSAARFFKQVNTERNEV